MRKLPESPFYSSCSIGDIDGNGEFEIALFLQNKLYVINKYGVIENGYPVSMNFTENIQSSPILVDINNDGKSDILYLTPDGRLEAVSKEVSPGFPIGVGHSGNSTPAVADIDGDGKIDVIAVADSTIYAYTLPSSMNIQSWPMMNYNTKNNRFYEFSPHAAVDTSLLAATNLYIYPNPSYNNFKLRFETYSAVKCSYRIFDISGTLKISSDEITPKFGINELDISVYDMAAGMYVLVLNLDSGSRKIEKKLKFTVGK